MNVGFGSPLALLHTASEILLECRWKRQIIRRDKYMMFVFLVPNSALEILSIDSCFYGINRSAVHLIFCNENHQSQRTELQHCCEVPNFCPFHVVSQNSEQKFSLPHLMSWYYWWKLYCTSSVWLSLHCGRFLKNSGSNSVPRWRTWKNNGFFNLKKPSTNELQGSLFQLDCSIFNFSSMFFKEIDLDES